MKNYQIFGNIVSTQTEKQCLEDVCLQDIKDFIDTLEPNEDFTLEVCSGGGDVFTGIAIANLIKQASSNGNHSTAHVISLAASIASVICSACDKIQMDENAFFMVHLPYGCFIDCNEVQLKKEIETLDRCKKALISFYKSKFDLSDEEIENMLIAETWIDGKSVEAYKFDCEVLKNEQPLKLAASIRNTISHFNNKTIIESILDMTNENKEKVEQTDEQLEKQQEEVTVEKTEETVTEPKVAECDKPCQEEQGKCKGEEVTAEPTTVTEEVPDTPAEPTYEQLKKENEELKEKIEELRKEIDEPVDKRVSGMQAKMQLKLNDLNKDFTDKIKDFKNQLEQKTQELEQLKAQSISLKDSLDKAESELHDCVSALEVKNQALEKLNASVNTPMEAETTDWKNLHGKAFIDWIEKHPHGI